MIVACLLHIGFLHLRGKRLIVFVYKNGLPLMKWLMIAEIVRNLNFRAAFT